MFYAVFYRAYSLVNFLNQSFSGLIISGGGGGDLIFRLSITLNFVFFFGGIPLPLGAGVEIDVMMKEKRKLKPIIRVTYNTFFS